jgi:Flp pilus assembly protein TadB
MNSEREKREREIQKLINGASGSRDAEVEFREEIRKTASAIFEQETRKLQKIERAERPKRSINIATAGLWLIVLGVAGFVFWMPELGVVALVCGAIAIVWGTILKPANKKRGKTSHLSKGRIS